MNLRKKTVLWRCILVAALILVLDQSSKLFMLANYAMQETVALLPSLNLRLAHNNGAAFGLLSEAAGWQRWLFIGLASVISAVIVIWCARLSNKDKWEGLALALILGGAIGNLLDRIRYGHVVDFIDFYVQDWHWYTFNIADIAICVGATLIMLVSIRKP